MGVYLKGARDATIKFADLYTRNRATAARADYEELLNDLQKKALQDTAKPCCWMTAVIWMSKLKFYEID